MSHRRHEHALPILDREFHGRYTGEHVVREARRQIECGLVRQSSVEFEIHPDSFAACRTDFRACRVFAVLSPRQPNQST